MGIANQARHGVRWGLFSSTVNQLLSWIATIWVIRILSPEDYAMIALSDLVVGMLLILGRLGFHGAIIRAPDLNSYHLSQMFTLLVIVNVTVFLALQATAAPISLIFEKPSLEALIRFSAISLLILPVQVISSALNLREMKYKKSAKLSLAVNLIHIVVNLALALMGYGFWALAGGLLVAQVCGTVGSLYISKFQPRIVFCFRGLGRFLQDSNYSFATGVTWAASNRLDTLLITSLTTGTALGVYRVALALSEKPVNILTRVSNQVGLVSFSKVSSDIHLVGIYVVKATNVMSFFTFPVFFGIAAIAPSLIPLLLGDKWSAAILPLQILCFAQLVNCLKEITGAALFAIGHSRRKFLQSIAVLVSTALGWWLGLQYGFEMGCLGFSISYILWFVWHVFDTSRYIEIGKYWIALLIPSFLSLIMSLAVWFVGTWLSNFGLSPSLNLLLQVFSRPICVC